MEIGVQVMEKKEETKVEVSSTTLYSHTDEELVLEVTNGNRGAFAVLVRRHTQKFYYLAYRLIFNKNDAEDIVQDCFIKLWQKPQMWDKAKKTKFTTWFYRVVNNACIDYNRKHSRVGAIEKEELIADKREFADEAIYQEQKESLLKKAIKELPERQQQALALSYYQNLSNKETAEIIGVSVKAVESLLVRAKKTLKMKLGGEE